MPWYLQIGTISTVHKTPGFEAILYVDPTLMDQIKKKKYIIMAGYP